MKTEVLKLYDAHDVPSVLQSDNWEFKKEVQKYRKKKKTAKL